MGRVATTRMSPHGVLHCDPTHRTSSPRVHASVRYYERMIHCQLRCCKAGAFAGTVSLVTMVVMPLMSSSCGSDRVCPGHVDPSRGPGLVIQTSDGSPSIASAEFRVDPKATVGASPCSFFTMERPDASVGSGYPQVTVYVRAGVFVYQAPPWDAEPASCLIDVSSVDGQSITVTASTISHHRVTQHCVGNYDCCSKSDLEWLGDREFYPTVVTLPFTHAIDASVDGTTDISPVDVRVEPD
jgi:hypothetical protein